MASLMIPFLGSGTLTVRHCVKIGCSSTRSRLLESTCMFWSATGHNYTRHGVPSLDIANKVWKGHTKPKHLTLTNIPLGRLARHIYQRHISQSRYYIAPEPSMFSHWCG